METTLPVAVGASFTDYHRFYLFSMLLLFIVCVLEGSFSTCSGRFSGRTAYKYLGQFSDIYNSAEKNYNNSKEII